MLLKAKFNTLTGVNDWSISKVNIISRDPNGELKLYIGRLGDGQEIKIDPAVKKVYSRGWSKTEYSYLENEVKNLIIEIGNRKYTFIDFSLNEVEELVKGEGLE